MIAATPIEGHLRGYSVRVCTTTSGLLSRYGPWRRIAVLRPGRIGDYLCATPAVRALKRTEPHARPDDGTIPLDAAIPLPGYGAEADRALALVRHLGAEAAGCEYDLRLRVADRAQAGRILHGLPRPVIGMHCGARDDGRRIAPEVFGQVTSNLTRGSVVVLGGPEERAIGARLAAAVTGVACRDLTGKVSLATAAAVRHRLPGQRPPPVGLAAVRVFFIDYQFSSAIISR